MSSRIEIELFERRKRRSGAHSGLTALRPEPLFRMGEGLTDVKRCRRETYPRPPTPHLSSPHLVPEGQPSGGMPLAGRGRRLRVGLRPTPGRLRGTALGVLRPLCEELAGRHGGTAPAGPGRDKAGIGPKSGLARFGIIRCTRQRRSRKRLCRTGVRVRRSAKRPAV